MSSRKKGREKKSPMKKALVLRVDLDENLKKQFEDIKKHYHLNSNTEVLRFCISQTHQSEDLDIPSELKKKISWIINHPTIREKHAIYDFNDFVRRSLSFYLQQMKKSLGDLNDWSFRQQLEQDERDIANEIVQLQEENKLGVTIKDLSERLNDKKITEERIREVVNKFVDLSVLDNMQQRGKTYYHTME
ncbi:MAG: hypothetical protein ACXAEU_02250 [Candidatus Hodarchaeales archaeon]|jgi:hypothetical protein